MNVTITLGDIAAKQIVRGIAYSYAASAIYSAMDKPRGTVNAPWDKPWSRDRKPLAEAFRLWSRTKDRERIAYRKALESFMTEIPAAPVVAWREYKGHDGRVFPVHFHSSRVVDAAKEYAERVVAIVFTAA